MFFKIVDVAVSSWSVWEQNTLSTITMEDTIWDSFVTDLTSLLDFVNDNETDASFDNTEYIVDRLGSALSVIRHISEDTEAIDPFKITLDDLGSNLKSIYSDWNKHYREILLSRDISVPPQFRQTVERNGSIGKPKFCIPRDQVSI